MTIEEFTAAVAEDEKERCRLVRAFTAAEERAAAAKKELFAFLDRTSDRREAAEVLRRVGVKL